MKEQTLYYAMSLPELLCVFIVLFFWMLSIYHFIKHFKKISTVERSGMYLTSPNAISISPLNKLSLMVIHDNMSIKDKSLSTQNLFSTTTHDKHTSFDVHSETTKNLLVHQVNGQLNSKTDHRLSIQNIKRACSEPVMVNEVVNKHASIFVDKPFFRMDDLNKQRLDKTKTKTHEYFAKKSQTESLLNPNIIPMAVKKSLIDLHKRSAWNLAHNSYAKTHQPTPSATTHVRVKGTLSRRYKTQDSDDYV